MLGEDVTFAQLRRLVRATAGWLGERSDSPRVLVGFDTRFASRAMAETAADVLAEAGLSPQLTPGPVPTPVLSHAVHRRRVAGGLMLTASHNPAEYHGLKLFSAEGGALPDADARRIEAHIARQPDHVAPAARRGRGADLAAAYVRDLGRLLDRDRLAAARVRVAYDAMHGCGAGVLDGALGDLGCRVVALRQSPDPHFAGVSPDPLPSRLGGLRELVSRSRGVRLGLATDGDADRLAVVLPGGRVLSETEMTALLVDHLARTGRVRRGVGASLASGSLLTRVAGHHGLATVRRSIGFKHLASLLASGAVDVAGDESGGFAWSKMGVDKDGLLAAALFCEIAAEGRGGVVGRLAELESRFGAGACGRSAISCSPERLAALDRLIGAAPERVDGAAVTAVGGEDGLRLGLSDGFLMWRRSGTEPLLRIYAEAPTPRRLAGRLAAGKRLLDAAIHRRR